MLELSPVDELICEQYLKEDIFEELNPKDIPQTEGAIAVLCSDCDRFRGAMEDLWTLSATWRSDPRTHIFALNGGALCLANDPFAEPIPVEVLDGIREDKEVPPDRIPEIHLRLIYPNGRHDVVRTNLRRNIPTFASYILLDHIAQAEEMKGIETLLLNVHAPCGVARHFGWNLEDVTTKVVAATGVVRKWVAAAPALPIVPVCRVLRDGREKPFRVNRERFLATVGQI